MNDQPTQNSTTRDMDAFDEGYDAFVDNHLDRDACPYPIGAAKRKDWLRGWDCALDYAATATWED